MRFMNLLPLALLAACATPAPVTRSPAPTPAPSALVSKAPGASQEFASIDESNLAKAQAAGYKVVNENGKTLYCRRSLVTGTRLHYSTECLTAEELARANDATRDAARPGPMANYNGPGG
jgi:hypothetical protein